MAKKVIDPTTNKDDPDFELLWRALVIAQIEADRFSREHPRTALDHGTLGIMAGKLIDLGFGRVSDDTATGEYDVTITLTRAELVSVGADLMNDHRAKIGPRLTGSKKIVDAALSLVAQADQASRSALPDDAAPGGE